MKPSANENSAEQGLEVKNKEKKQGLFSVILCVVLVLVVVLLAGTLHFMNSEPEPTQPETTSTTQATTEPTTPPVTEPVTEPEPVDETAPEIHNAIDREFWLGEAIVYADEYIRETDAGKTTYPKVTAVDDTEIESLTVDYDGVNPQLAGTYPVTYTATDTSGNQTSVTVRFTLVEKPQDYVDPETVYDMAGGILRQITTEQMSDMEVAFAIYRWTRTEIRYGNRANPSSWTEAAYQAFTHGSGTGYHFFAVAKALFTAAGIENMDVTTTQDSQIPHFWSLINLGDGWYHVDCTPHQSGGYLFMNTDAELEAFSIVNKNSHIFDSAQYPERAKDSVQANVDYLNGIISD